MNLRFEYLYRDAANYKAWCALVVSNPGDAHSAATAEQAASKVLIDGAWFVAAAADLPDLRGDEWDDELDHDWHELHGFAETDVPPDDPRGRDIRGLLESLAEGAVTSA